MSDRRCPECFEILECPSCDPSITHMAHDFEEDGLREAAQPFLEAALNVFPEEWISPGSSYAISITVRGSEVDALRAALRATPETPCRCGKPESDPIHGPQSSALDHAFEAALRSTPAAPTHTPKVMEAEAGRLLVESARIRAARLGPDDAHELRHLWAAINAGNSDPCGETCHLDADAIARWTEQYPKVMGLVALRSTPTARKPDARSLADRITGVIAIPPDGEVEP